MFDSFMFPHSSNYDSDLRELLRMYKQLSEDYDKIKNGIDEAVDKVQNFYGIVNTEIDKAVVQRMININGQLNSLSTQMKSFSKLLHEHSNNLINMQTEIKQHKSDMSKSINEIRTEIAQLYAEWGYFKDDLMDLFEGRCQELVDKILEDLKDIERLVIWNPLMGTYSTIQEVINLICEYLLLSYGLTANEYDAMKLTAGKYDSLAITAMEYNARGVFKFFGTFFLNMRSPFTGLQASYETVINQLANLHKDSYTVDEYINLLIDCDEWDLLALTAYNLDWHSRQYIQ